MLGQSTVAYDHSNQFQVWDAVIMASAAASGARVLFSEDMQDGFLWHDVTILNPFAANPDLIVRELLNIN